MYLFDTLSRILGLGIKEKIVYKFFASFFAFLNYIILENLLLLIINSVDLNNNQHEILVAVDNCF